MISAKSEITQDHKINLLTLVVENLITQNNEDFTNFLLFDQIVDEVPDFILGELWERLKDFKGKNQYFESKIFELQSFLIVHFRKLNRLSTENKQIQET